jgi:hypothetical protein
MRQSQRERVERTQLLAKMTGNVIQWGVPVLPSWPRHVVDLQDYLLTLRQWCTELAGAVITVRFVGADSGDSSVVHTPALPPGFMGRGG